MSFIDFSSESDDDITNIKSDNDLSFAEIDRHNEHNLTPSLLKTHEKKFEQETFLLHPPDIIIENNSNETAFQRVQTQFNENMNTSLVYGFAENLEILRNMNEEICERLDWVTQQTQQITDQFNEDRELAHKERNSDRRLGLFFSFLEAIFFLVGILYASVLFVIEMYYSVNVGIF